MDAVTISNENGVKEIVTRDGMKLTVRPIEEKDLTILRRFYENTTERGLAMMRANLLDDFFENRYRRLIEQQDITLLSAWFGRSLAGVVLLDRGRYTWTRHVANIRCYTHPDFQHHGIATILLREAFENADLHGYEKLYCYLVSEQKNAIRITEKFGFTLEAVLHNHAKDRYGRYHEMLMYSVDLGEAHRRMDQMLESYIPYGG